MAASVATDRMPAGAELALMLDLDAKMGLLISKAPAWRRWYRTLADTEDTHIKETPNWRALLQHWWTWVDVSGGLGGGARDRLHASAIACGSSPTVDRCLIYQ
jgi:hypothetical protein